MSNKTANITSGFLSVLVILSSVWAVWQRQNILDWWRLRKYQPSVAVQQLSEDASFSDLGEKLFYVHNPQILKKESFGDGCSLTEETIVLGCYITHDQIFVFDVDDERLEGVEQVTAAHEVLHAAYDRLSGSEKERVDSLLAEVYALIDDERLRTNVEAYRERDASIVPNELHSILGTEVVDLPQELEDYYSQYFINRIQVVQAAQSYEEEFTRREDLIKELDARLIQLDADISSDQTEIGLFGDAINQERSQLDLLRSSDTLSYNAGVPVFNGLVASYNTLVQDYRSLVDEYNNVVAERNGIALEEKQLIEAIDTRVEEI